jgi:hypothetical protein
MAFARSKEQCMPKQFITEHDIEDMVKSGLMTLEITDQVVLTDLAYEKANRLGMRLIRERPDNPPSAPVRPYISQKAAAAPATAAASTVTQPAEADLHQRIKNAVVARMGSQVDAALLDTIITRVLHSTGVK